MRALVAATSAAALAGANFVSVAQRFTADPAPLVVGDRVYIYTSHDIANQSSGWVMKDYAAFTSIDLLNWEDLGVVFTTAGSQWATEAWAQQVVRGDDGKFYMYFPNGGNGGVGVAVSTSPRGPFTDALGHALSPGGGDDPTAFRDDDGSWYLCSNSGGPLCARLGADMVSLATMPALVTGFSSAWQWFEAPWLEKVNGTYYLSYMAQRGVGTPSHFGFDIAYAVSTAGPLGPYAPAGSLMWSPPWDCGPRPGTPSLCTRTNNGGDNNHQGARGAGLHYLAAASAVAGSPPDAAANASSHDRRAGFFTLNGKRYVAYHNRKVAVDHGEYMGYQRNIAIDRAYFDAGGPPIPGAPGAVPHLPISATPDWLAPARYFNPYSFAADGAPPAPVPAVVLAGASRWVGVEPCAEGGRNVAPMAPGTWTRVAAVDFGATPPTALRVRTAAAAAGAVLAAYVDGNGTSPASRLVATCAVPQTGSGQAWANVTCVLAPGSGPTGVHDVYFVSAGRAAPALQWWLFEGGAATGRAPPPFTGAISVRARAVAGWWTVDPTGDGALTVTAGSPTSAWAHFNVTDNEDGTYALASAGSGRLLCVAPASGGVFANASSPADPCARWLLLGTPDTSYAVQARGGRGNFVAVNAATRAVAATAPDVRSLVDDSGRWFLQAA